LVDGLATLGAHRLLLVCDRTLAPGTSLGTSTSAPYLMAEGSNRHEATGRRFTESTAEAGKPGVRDATKLIGRLLASR
jgi:hypothetical protein